MNVTGVRVKIYNKEECVYEHEISQSDQNELATLLQDLRNVQSGVNDFLSALIQQQDAFNSGQKTTNRSSFSDIESDSVEEEEDEVQVNPKKCKLSN